MESSAVTTAAERSPLSAVIAVPLYPVDTATAFPPKTSEELSSPVETATPNIPSTRDLLSSPVTTPAEQNADALKIST